MINYLLKTAKEDKDSKSSFKEILTAPKYKQQLRIGIYLNLCV